jgi:hypothetical protein
MTSLSTVEVNSALPIDEPAMKRTEIITPATGMYI